MVDIDRARLRELADAATEGPWIWHQIHGDKPERAISARTYCTSGGTCVLVFNPERHFVRSEDATFMAAARSAVPALLDRIDELEASLRAANRLAR
jgi:hypothetical protein